MRDKADVDYLDCWWLRIAVIGALQLSPQSDAVTHHPATKSTDAWSVDLSP